MTYCHDKANQLISDTAGCATNNYAYDDDDGNLKQNGQVTNTYNQQDQLTSSSGPATSLSYAGMSTALASETVVP